MFNSKNFKIVLSYNGHDYLVDTFSCTKCRSIMQCDKNADCKLYNYLKERMPNTRIDEGNTIKIQSDNYDRSIVLINRAIKLRKHRIR